MDLSVNFENLKFNHITIIFGVYIIILGIIYYLIFHKHHKRNQVDFGELISLLTKYYSLSIISTLLIVFGIYCFGLAHEYSYDRTEVIMYMITGILIISLTIINYIFYIKRNLVDYNQTIREMNKKSMLKVGEVLEFIIFTIFVFAPIWRIPAFIELFDDKRKMILEIVKSFLLSIGSIILLINLNPLDVKNGFRRIREEKKRNKLKNNSDNKNIIEDDEKENSENENNEKDNNEKDNNKNDKLDNENK